MTNFLDNDLDELSQASVDEIGDDADALGLTSVQSLLDKASHVLLEHGLDVSVCSLVRLEDGLRSKKTALLGTIWRLDYVRRWDGLWASLPVPVELNGVGSFAFDNILGVKEGTEHLHGGDGTASIIVSSGSGENGGQEEVDGVLVSANDDGLVGLAGDGGDDRVLLPGMGEALGEDGGVGSSLLDDAVDLLEDPVGGLQAVRGLVVSGVEAGQLLEVGPHVLLVEILGERNDLVLLDALLGKDNGGSGLGISAEGLGGGDVHEVLAILRDEC